MSAKSVKEFLDKIAQDEALRDELTNAVKGRDDRESAAAEVAAMHGFEFDAEELKRILDVAQGAPANELTEEELDAVAAGLTVFQQIRFAPPYVPVGGITPDIKANPINDQQINPDVGGHNIP